MSLSPAIRRPATNALYGEFLINAQGEDVVAGIRTPQNITEAARIEAGSEKPSMETALPDRVRRVQANLRPARGGTIAKCRTWSSPSRTAKLWMLQTRSGKRTTKASLRIAVDMAERRA